MLKQIKTKYMIINIEEIEFPEDPKAKKLFINIFNHELFHSNIYAKFGISTIFKVGNTGSCCYPKLKPFMKPKNLFKFIFVEIIHIIYDLIYMIYDKNTLIFQTIIGNGRKLYDIIKITLLWKRIIFKDMIIQLITQ